MEPLNFKLKYQTKMPRGLPRFMLQDPRPRTIFVRYRSKHLLCLAKKLDKNNIGKNLKDEFRRRFGACPFSRAN